MFDVCEGGLVPDVMHDHLEGALQYEVKLMLQSFIQVETIFQFGNLQYLLKLGYVEKKDRPTPITSTTLMSSGHSLKQLGKLIKLKNYFRLSHSLQQHKYGF